jgi:hypothetical protein
MSTDTTGPQWPTDEDLYDLAEVFNGDPVPALRRALELWGQSAPIVPPELIRALELAESCLADIGDAEREPGDDLAWAEARAAGDLPRIRQALNLWRDQVAAVAPVAVSERPWEREGFCDARGMCWVGEPKRDYPLGQTGDFDIWSAEWKLTDPTTLCGAARLIALLPHWAIPLPITTQEPQL